MKNATILLTKHLRDVFPWNFLLAFQKMFSKTFSTVNSGIQLICKIGFAMKRVIHLRGNWKSIFSEQVNEDKISDTLKVQYI